MDVFETIKKRRSIRKFKDVPIQNEKLFQVLEAARLSPSAGNRQPWRFIVITEEKEKKRIGVAYGADWLVHAPVIIVACAVPTEAWLRADGEEYFKVDVAIALHSLMLAATELGLGTCWIANFDEKKAKIAINAPEDWRVVALTPLGLPDEEIGPVRNRKPIEEIVCFQNCMNSSHAGAQLSGDKVHDKSSIV